MNLEILDYPSRVIHAASLLIVSAVITYMTVRDRDLVPRIIRATQVAFALYIAWHAMVMIAAPLVNVDVRVVLRTVGALISAVFAAVIVRHVREMRTILRPGKNDNGGD